jgi:hypothetical protein
MSALAALTAMPLQAQDSSQAVVIQGWTPEQGASHQSGDTLRDELWNDSYLWVEHLWDRPAIGHDTARIHMLWGEGNRQSG